MSPKTSDAPRLDLPVKGMHCAACVGKVERAVLRLGTFELLYMETTPVPVVIDESIELARAYAGDEASQFINGVLGHVARERV